MTYRRTPKFSCFQGVHTHSISYQVEQYAAVTHPFKVHYWISWSERLTKHNPSRLVHLSFVISHLMVAHQLILWSRILKLLIVTKLFRKLCAFYGPCPEVCESSPHPLTIFNIIFLHVLGLPGGSFPSGFLNKILYGFLNSCVCCILCTYQHPLYNHPNNIWWRIQIMKLPIM
jgi:hypothetical protein